MINEIFNCPICRKQLLEIHAGLYCYNVNCILYKQKAVACCEGGELGNKCVPA